MDRVSAALRLDESPVRDRAGELFDGRRGCDRVVLAGDEQRRAFDLRCGVGAPLARVEGQIAIGTLVRRFPYIALGTDQPRYKEQLTLRGLESLPVTFTAA
jgi:hypothetical protein